MFSNHFYFIFYKLFVWALCSCTYGYLNILLNNFYKACTLKILRIWTQSLQIFFIDDYVLIMLCFHFDNPKQFCQLKTSLLQQQFIIERHFHKIRLSSTNPVFLKLRSSPHRHPFFSTHIYVFMLAATLTNKLWQTAFFF